MARGGLPWWTEAERKGEVMGQDETGKDVARWSDQAMFKAEEMPTQALLEPVVHLVWMTPDPLGAAAAMNAMYKGKVKRSLADVTRAEREALISDMMATALKAPFEAIKLHFLIEGVTRGFTHQLVRQRTAVYAQESTRFAVFGEEQALPVGLPPSLQGTQSRDGFLVDGAGMSVEEWNRAVEMATPEQRARLEWDEGMGEVQRTYVRMVDAGMPAEDARGILPTNLLTRIHYVTDLRNLHAHAGTRLSTQAQFEWKMVWKGIINAIRSYDPLREMKSYLNRGFEGAAYTGEIRRMMDRIEHYGAGDTWQYEAISEIFRPVCYYTGKCEFMATADRACSIRDRVQANHAIGRPSSEWDTEHPGLEGRERVAAIHPGEWLTDPAAARKRA